MVRSLIEVGVGIGVSLAAVTATTALGFGALRLLLGQMARRLKSTH